MKTTHTNAEESTAQAASDLQYRLLMIVGNYEKSRDQQQQAKILLGRIAKANRVHAEMINELQEKYEMLKRGIL